MALSLAACGPVSPYGPQPAPVPKPDPAPVEASDCAKAQTKLTELDCSYKETPQGDTFENACLEAAADGRNFRPDCIALVESCDDVEKAFKTPEGKPCN